LCAAWASGQAAQPQPEKPPMADDVFKNIQVLRGLTVDQFMSTMGFFSAALGLNCSGCHDMEEAAALANDNPRKQTSRRMILMVNALNNTNFGGTRRVTCYSCHRGDTVPKITPSLVEQYSAPAEDDPNEVELVNPPMANAPSANQILDRYIQALGGAQRLANLNSFVGHGTYEGYDTAHEKVPLDVFAKSPNQRTTVVHLPDGDSIRIYDGRNAWITSTGTLMPIPVVSLTAGELAGARLDAALSFPAQIKQLLKAWRTGFPSVAIDDHDVEVVQGDNDDGTPVRLYFDKQSGLLLRQFRFTNTVVGFNPVQIDYADYRDVAGVKFPFKLTTTWTDGQTIIEFQQVRTNVPVDNDKFVKPMTPAR
jgi:outer membrane lipoprotein-sorting protein